MSLDGEIRLGYEESGDFMFFRFTTTAYLRRPASERLLDIGCGWGGLVMHAAGRSRQLPH